MTVKAVPDPRSDMAAVQRNLDAIAVKLRDVMGESCEIVFDFVDDIPREKSGKYLYTVCKVAPTCAPDHKQGDLARFGAPETAPV